MLVGDGSGAGGGAVLVDAVRQSRPAPAAKRLIFYRKNNGRTAAATFDNSYRKCYNKCNDDNKKAICHQSPKFALYGVFAFRDIKSRGAAENAV